MIEMEELTFQPFRRGVFLHGEVFQCGSNGQAGLAIEPHPDLFVVERQSADLWHLGHGIFPVKHGLARISTAKSTLNGMMVAQTQRPCHGVLHYSSGYR
jgi:hypothetical protein